MFEEHSHGLPSPSSPRAIAQRRQCRRVRADAGCPCAAWFCRLQAGRPPRVLCCGSREWVNWDFTLRVLSTVPAGTLIIHGGADGADEIAGSCASTCNLPIHEFPANWQLHGRAAGPIRNRRMLEIGQPDIVFAFASNIEQTKGTKGMVALARKADVPVIVFDGTEGSFDQLSMAREGLF